MTWSCSEEGDGDGEADGVGDAAAEPDGAAEAGEADAAAEADAPGEPEAAGAVDAAADDADAPTEAAGLDTGVGVGVPTRGWPVTSEADEVRITALATAAETNPMIRPTR